MVWVPHRHTAKRRYRGQWRQGDTLNQSVTLFATLDEQRHSRNSLPSLPESLLIEKNREDRELPADARHKCRC
jgi:hypothetical protein